MNHHFFNILRIKKRPALTGRFTYFRDLLLLLNYHWYPYAAPTIASFLLKYWYHRKWR